MFRHLIRQLFPYGCRSVPRPRRAAFYRPLLVTLEGRLAPATCMFNYSASSAWEDAANWSNCNGKLPGENDVAQIGNPGHAALVTLSSSQTISRLEATGSPQFTTGLTVDGDGSLEATNSWQVIANFALTLAGGTLTVNPIGTYTLTNSSFHYTSGIIAVNPKGTFPAIVLVGIPMGGNAALSIDPAATGAAMFACYGNCTLNGKVSAGQTVLVEGNNTGQDANLTVAKGTVNAGTIRLESRVFPRNASLTISAGATFTNAPGGLIQGNVGSGGLRSITGSNTGIYEAAGGSIQGAYVVNAQVRVTASPAGGTTIPLGGSNNTLLGNNLAGTVLWVQGNGIYGDGALRLTAGASNAGTIQLESRVFPRNANLVIPSGTFTNAAGGLIQVNQGSGGPRTITGNLTNQGLIDVTGGNPLAITGGVFEAAGGFIQGSGFVLNAQVRVTASPPVGMETTVPIAGASALLGNNLARTVLWVQGNDTGQDANLTVANGTVNAGTIRLESSMFPRNANLVIPSGTFTNAAGGLIQVNRGSTGSRSITGRLVNAGTLQVNTDLSLDGTSGDDHVNTGTISFTAGAKLFVRGHTFVNQPTGSIVGNGTFDSSGGPLSNYGTVRVPERSDQLVLTGPFTNFSVDDRRLSSGTYEVTGILRFDNATIETDEANIVLSGTAARISPTRNDNDALSGLAVIRPHSSFTIKNGRNMGTAMSPLMRLQNDGVLRIDGGNSTFYVDTYGQGTAAELDVNTGRMRIQMAFTPNFDKVNSTLTGGIYRLTGADSIHRGTLQFKDAHIVTNAATIELIGPCAEIIDQDTNDALKDFARNTAAGSFTVQGCDMGMRREITIMGPFTNAGQLKVGSDGVFTATAGFTQSGMSAMTTIQANGSVSLMGGVSTGRFTLDAGGTLTFAGSSFALNTGTLFTGPGLVKISGATVSVNTSIMVQNAEVAAGTLMGTGTFTVTGQLKWTGGTMSGAGMTMIGSTGTLDINGSDNKYLTSGRQLCNAGTVTWGSSGGIWIGGGSTFENRRGGIFDAQSDAAFLNDGGAAPSFLNDGTFRKSAGSGTTLFAAGVSFMNSGTLEARAGTLRFDGTLTQTGTLSILAGGTAILQGGGTSSGSITNAGTLVIGSGSRFAESGTYSETGMLEIQAGAELDLLGGGSGNGRFSDDGTLVVGAGSTFTETGSYSQTGTMVVQATATLTLAGSFANFDGAMLMGGTYDILGTFQFANAAVITNAATIILDGPDAFVADENGNDAFASFAANADSGSFTLQNGSAETTGDDFQNAGNLTVGTDSSFTVGGNYTQTGGTTLLAGGSLTASGGVVDLQGGILCGAGTINASVQNEAEIDVGGPGAAGLLAINGDFTQAASGVLNLEIGGYNAGTDFDQLAISGQANLDGTLNVSLLNGFVPQSGDSFQVLTAGAVDGVFAGGSIDPAFGPVQYDPMDVTLVAL